MAEKFADKVEVLRGNDATITLDANVGNITMGGHGADGDLLVNDKEGRRTIHLDGDRQNITLTRPDGETFVELGRHGNLVLGGGGLDGDLVVRTSAGEDTVHIDGNGGNIWAGGKGTDGDVVLFPPGATDLNDASQSTIWMNANHGNMMLGGNGTDGDIALFPNGVGISASDFDDATIHLDADAGDIRLRNADLAEEFDAVEDGIAPGTVLAIHGGGAVGPSMEAYDSRVVGVAAGAGDYAPGIVLDRRAEGEGRVVVSLAGKASCLADATEEPIRAGDLLTTGSRPGHAMRASDPQAAFGAVLGKALGDLTDGRGLVPVLVTLQ